MGQMLSPHSALPLTSQTSREVISTLWVVSSSAKWEGCASTTGSLWGELGPRIMLVGLYPSPV